MADACAECKAWRAEQYWNVFPDNKHHFFKIMLGDFTRFLRIPIKFRDEFKGKLSKTVTLRGPSGNCWKTTTTTRGHDVVLQDGWQDFANDHNLNQGDFLVFQYVEDSSFQVLIFDVTGCEREDAHFVQPGVENCCASRDNISGGKIQTELSQEEGSSDDNKGSKRRKRKNERKNRKKEKQTLLEESECNDEGTEEGPSGINSKSREEKNDNKSRYSMYYKSNRRTITTKDKERAFLLASQHSTKKPSCMIRMKPSHVEHLFILTIPKEFADNCLPMKSQNISLRVGSRTWPLKLNRRNVQCTLNTGWAQFVLENNIEIEDICVLEQAHTGARTHKQPTTLDVHIYRVVEKTVPLEVVKPSQQGRS